MTGEQVELGGGQIDPTCRERDLTTHRIDDEIADDQRPVVAGRHGHRAPQHGTDAGEQLARAEWLDEIVVGTDFQPNDTVGLVAAGGEHDDRHGRGSAQRTGDIEPVHIRQSEVEHDQVRCDRAHVAQRFIT